ncbi:hypothetical protein ACHAWO_011483 [Cyclotella atomus]|uniref:Uncharacterized protein n=1 Tax=Cyclotella atomus TaxID=382360 RepID=A0ABD3MX70_9STRA
MCIIFLAINSHPSYPLIIASNRDEFLDRPTKGMSLWPSTDKRSSDSITARRASLLAGRDSVAGGTWLGLDVSNKDVIQGKPDVNVATKDVLHNSNENSLRWIALTNYLGENDNETTMHDKTSRGSLLTEYLQMDESAVPNGSSAESFVKNLCHRGDEYNGFSVLVADATGVYYYTNRGEETKSNLCEPLPPGIYGLSNDLLDSNWPKVTRGKEMLSKICKNHTTATLSELHESLMDMLRDEWKPTSNQYPDPARCSIFVPEHVLDGRGYGTRSSTTILVEKDGGRVSVLERTWLTGEDRSFYLLPKSI